HRHARADPADRPPHRHHSFRPDAAPTMSPRRAGARGARSDPAGLDPAAASGLDPDALWPPSRVDPVARAATVIIGGPAGRRLGPATGVWRTIPVLMLLSLVMLAGGIVQKQHCRAQGWHTPDQFWHACYSDIGVLYGSSALGGPGRPDLQDAVGPHGLG